MGSQKYADLIAADPNHAATAAIIARSVEKCRRMLVNEQSGPAVPLARVAAGAVEHMQDYSAMNPGTLPVFIVSVDPHLRLAGDGSLTERAPINLFVNATQAARDAGRNRSGGAVFTMRFPALSGAVEPDRGPGHLKSLAASAK